MIRIETANKSEIGIDKAEVLRYLGYGKNVPDETIVTLIEKCSAEMSDRLSIKACYDKYALAVNGDELSFGNVKVVSKSLRKNLKGCDDVIVFAATIGADIDRIIQRYSMTSPASAVVAQAVGAAFIEKWCDVLCLRFARAEIAMDKFLRPRFSPGYGDFPLECQKDIFLALDCPRKIGVSLTDSLLMAPSKSVSAVIGIGDADLKCHKSGCEVCTKTDCDFRRG